MFGLWVNVVQGYKIATMVLISTTNSYAVTVTFTRRNANNFLCTLQRNGCNHPTCPFSNEILVGGINFISVFFFLF